jgi:hypothetical protein
MNDNRFVQLIERKTGDIIISIGEGKLRDSVALAMMEAFKLGYENAEREFKRAKVDPKKRANFLKSLLPKGGKR